MGRYLKLAILTAGLWTCAAAAMTDDPAASTQSPPAAATATHAMAATAVAPTSTAPTPTTASMPVQPNNGPSLPIRGMNMENVEHIFGAPQEKLAAVPDPGSKLHPPITRWVYPNYVVYFEYNVVIHTVLKAHPFNRDPSKY
ncbi:MAG TPA: hypothetical protein VNI53_08440 [Gammaproteobacteria bacterium]|nr:hypothetical protein [Gammaproteobacteria bacterium]